MFKKSGNIIDAAENSKNMRHTNERGNKLKREQLPEKKNFVLAQLFKGRLNCIQNIPRDLYLLM